MQRSKTPGSSATRLDYRGLLLRYMAHVIRCEGTSFLDRSTDGFLFEPEIFSHEEVRELRNIEVEALDVRR